MDSPGRHRDGRLDHPHRAAGRPDVGWQRRDLAVTRQQVSVGPLWAESPLDGLTASGHSGDPQDTPGLAAAIQRGAAVSNPRAARVTPCHGNGASRWAPRPIRPVPPVPSPSARARLCSMSTESASISAVAFGCFAGTRSTVRPHAGNRRASGPTCARLVDRAPRIPPPVTAVPRKGFDDSVIVASAKPHLRPMFEAHSVGVHLHQGRRGHSHPLPNATAPLGCARPGGPRSPRP